MRHLTLYLVAFSLLLAGPAYAGAPWAKPFAGDPQKILDAANRSTRDSTDHVVVLHEETRYTFDKKGRATTRFYRVYKVITQKGVNDWSNVSMGWAPWYQQRPTIRVRVITPDGKTSVLDQKTLTVSPAPKSTHVYTDRRVLRGPITGVAPRSVIEEEYVIRDTQPFFAPGSIYRVALDMWVPVRKTVVTVDAPTSLRVRYEIRGSKAKPRVTTRGKRRTWQLVLGSSPARERAEPGLGPDAVRYPYVTISTGKSWNQMARFYSNIIEEKLGAEGRPDAAFATTGKDRMTIAKQALAYLHKHVRYTGLEFGQSSIIPWTPRETWQRKFGDCKDQATLLVSLLRQKGVRAHVALLLSGRGQDVRPSLPGMGGFNHAIVYIPGKRPIWIDPTDEFARAGELPISDQNRWALIARPTSRRLIRTPKSTSRDNRAIEDRVFHLAEDGKSRVVETSRYYGAYDRGNRSYYQRTDKKKVRKSLESYAKQEYVAKKLDRYQHSDLTNLSKPLQLTLEVSEVGRATTYLDEAVLYIPLGNLTEYLPSSLTAEQDDKKKREHPLILNTPHQKEWRYRIILPPGLVARHLPDNETLKLGPMVLSKTFSTRGREVLAHFKFDTVRDLLTPEEVAQARDALKKLSEDTAVRITLQQEGYALVDEGKTKEGIAEYRRLIALHPQEAIHHAHLALALLRVGLREPARQEARLAMRVEPSSRFGSATLAWVLQHDRIGRLHAKGFDHRGAVAAYRKAIALAPDESYLRQDLAVLLEYNERGERYGVKARLDEAATLYREAKRLEDAADMDENLMLVLFRARKFKEAAAIAKAAKPTQQRNALYIATTATLRGAPAAIKLADRLAEAAASRHGLLDSAASSLVAVGYYDRAARLVREAARNAPGAARFHTRADILARTKRIDVRKQKLVNTPSGVTRHLFVLLVSGKMNPAGMRSLFSPSLLKGTESDSFQVMKKGMVIMRDQFTNKGMSIQTGIDLVLSITAFTTEKLPHVGWKVSVSIANMPSPFVFFVRLESKRHYIAGSTSEIRSFGLGARRALKRGDLVQARAWLDLATKSVSKERGLLSQKAAFHEVWRTGQPRSRHSVRVAAAILLASVKHELILVEPILKKCATQQAGRGSACKRALFVAYNASNKHKKALTLVDDVLATDHQLRLETKMRLLMRLGRFSQMTQLARKRQATDATAEAPARWLAMAEQGNGNHRAALAGFEKLRAGSSANANHHNLAAWLTLFLDRTDDRAVDAARQSVTATKRRSHPSLNTLAAVHAARGELADAYRVLLEGLLVTHAKTPSRSDWLVFGKIAEGYGFRKEARHAYQRVIKKEKDEAWSPPTISSRALAKRWLRKLGK